MTTEVLNFAEEVKRIKQIPVTHVFDMNIWINEILVDRITIGADYEIYLDLKKILLNRNGENNVDIVVNRAWVMQDNYTYDLKFSSVVDILNYIARIIIAKSE